MRVFFEESGAVVPRAGICEGASGQPASPSLSTKKMIPSGTIIVTDRLRLRRFLIAFVFDVSQKPTFLSCFQRAVMKAFVTACGGVHLKEKMSCSLHTKPMNRLGSLGVATLLPLRIEAQRIPWAGSAFVARMDHYGTWDIGRTHCTSEKAT